MLEHSESTWQRIFFRFTVWMGKAGRSCSASSDAGSDAVCGAASTLPSGDGSVRRCPLLGSRDRQTRSRGQADESAFGAALREVEQK